MIHYLLIWLNMVFYEGKLTPSFGTLNTVYVNDLQDISGELEVKDLETLVPRLQRMTTELEEVSKYEQVQLIQLKPN